MSSSAEFYGLGYRECRELLAARLAQPASGRIQLLAGPRQVGNTTQLLELAEGPPLVVCDAAGRAAAERAGVEAVTWQEFLVNGPPRT